MSTGTPLGFVLHKMRSVLDRTTWINGDATVSVCALVEQDGGQILSVVGGKIAGPLGQSLFLNKYPHMVNLDLSYYILHSAS